MFSIIENFFQICPLIGVFVLIIVLLIRLDLKDKNEPQNTADMESEETKSVTDILYYERMSPDEKYQQLIVELDKIKKLLPCDRRLNEFQKRFEDVKQLQCIINNTYQYEQDEFYNMISWLEMPMVTRGNYQPLPHDKYSIDDINIEDVERAIRKTYEKPISYFEDPDCVDEDTDTKNEEIVQIQKPTKANILKMPDMKLQNVIQMTHFVNEFRPLVYKWSGKLYDDLMESIKIWFVVSMTIRHSVFNLKNFQNAEIGVSAFVQKWIIVQSEVDNNVDITIITLQLAPEVTGKAINKMYNVYITYIYPLIIQIKSIFQ